MYYQTFASVLLVRFQHIVRLLPVCCQLGGTSVFSDYCQCVLS